jgi:hypothetical protein
MGQARTALSLTAAGSPFTGIPLTLASAQADAGPHAKMPATGDPVTGIQWVWVSGLIRRLGLRTEHGALHQ